MNGVAAGPNSSSYNTWMPFTINSGFVAGVNTLDFVVTNTGAGPTGLRVDLSGTASPGSGPPPTIWFFAISRGLTAGSGRGAKAAATDGG